MKEFRFKMEDVWCEIERVWYEREEIGYKNGGGLVLDGGDWV